jgi:hypothetical protein
MNVLHNDTCHTGSPKIPDGIPMAFSILLSACHGDIGGDAPVSGDLNHNSDRLPRLCTEWLPEASSTGEKIILPHRKLFALF